MRRPPLLVSEKYQALLEALDSYVDAEKEATKEFWTREYSAVPPGKTIEVDGEIVAVKEDD